MARIWSLRGFIKEASVGSLTGEKAKGGLVNDDSVSNQGDLDGGHSVIGGRSEEGGFFIRSEMEVGGRRVLNPKLWEVLS